MATRSADNDMHTAIVKHFSHLAIKYPSLINLESAFAAAISLMQQCYAAGGKILVCGNGGSAADAEHIVGELMKGFLKPRPLSPELLQRIRTSQPEATAQLGRLQMPVPALSLVSGVALASAFANDVDAELLFAQQVLGLAKPEDLVWGVSTSGNSANVNLALKMARVIGCSTLALSGKDGGRMAQLCDVELRMPAQSTPAVQELHLPVYHALCACLEEMLFS